MMRKAKVVGKFVEFHGEGASSLSVTDRATIANMAPEYGATMGFFPLTKRHVRISARNGPSKEHVDIVRAYYKAQGMFGIPRQRTRLQRRARSRSGDRLVRVAGPSARRIESNCRRSNRSSTN